MGEQDKYIGWLLEAIDSDFVQFEKLKVQLDRAESQQLRDKYREEITLVHRNVFNAVLFIHNEGYQITVKKKGE